MSLGINSLGSVSLGSSDQDGGDTNDLLAENISSLSLVDNPEIAQSHIFIGDDIASLSNLSLPLLSLLPTAVNDNYNVTSGVQKVVAAPGILTNDIFNCT